MPKSWIAIVVLAMSLGQAALANPALGAAEVPFRGSDNGGFELPGSCPGGEEVVINGTGHATHLGAYAYAATECFDPQNGTFAGSATLRAANGDTIVGTYHGQVSGTADPDVIAYQSRGAGAERRYGTPCRRDGHSPRCRYGGPLHARVRADPDRNLVAA